MSNSTVLTDAFWVRKDTTPPSLVDNQAGDSALRIASGTLYDVDAFDGGGGLERLQYSVSLVAASADAAVVNWTDIPLVVGSTFYSSDWPLDFSSLTAASTNYVSIRAWDRAGSTTTLINAFFVLKDAAGPQVRSWWRRVYRSSLAAIAGGGRRAASWRGYTAEPAGRALLGQDGVQFGGAMVHGTRNCLELRQARLDGTPGGGGPPTPSAITRGLRDGSVCGHEHATAKSRRAGFSPSPR